MGPRDGANFATCVVVLTFLTCTKFFEGCPVACYRAGPSCLFGSRIAPPIPSQLAAAAEQAARRAREAPVRGPEATDRAHPYQRGPVEEDWFAADEVEPVPPTIASFREPQRDHWQLLVEKGVLRRHHVKWRSHPLSPWEGPLMPVAIASLTCEREGAGAAPRTMKTMTGKA